MESNVANPASIGSVAVHPAVARPAGRRIASIVLPELLCEAAKRKGPKASQEAAPLGVLFVSTPGAVEQNPKDRLAAVNHRARQLGARAGQTLTEARAELSSLRIEVVSHKTVEVLLSAIAEVARGFGSVVSYDTRATPPDTVWVDVTGVAHLFGGEDALARELRERVRLLGHTSRVVIAPGPLLGRALGLWGPIGSQGVLAVSDAEMSSAIEPLPLMALPPLAPRAAWFSSLGILSCGQLRELPAGPTAARLGPEAGKVLELLNGKDRTPLVPVRLPRVLREEQEWDEPTPQLEPLLFSLRGLLGRLSARLEARGEATSRLLLQLKLERTQKLRVEFELPLPVWRESELERVVRSRLERLVLHAPVLGIGLSASALSPRQERQLDWAASSREQEASRELPLLLTELEAEVGSHRVGFLMTTNSHRPEGRSALVSYKAAQKRRSTSLASGVEPRKELDRVTRLFEHPLALSIPIAVGSQFLLGKAFYTIKKLRLAERLAGVEWWTPHAVHRDYLWAWLESERGATEALLYVDHSTGERFLQGLAD